MSENASSRRSNSAINSVSEAVDSAGVQALTSSLYRSERARRSRSTLACSARVEDRGARRVRGHVESSGGSRIFAFAVANSSSVSTPAWCSCASSFRSAYGSRRGRKSSRGRGRRHPAGGRVRVLQLPVVPVLLRALPRDRERHVRLTRPKEKEHASAPRFLRARTFAFWASNSASVRIPCAFSSASSFSWAMGSGAASGGRGRRRAVARTAVAAGRTAGPPAATNDLPAGARRGSRRRSRYRRRRPCGRHLGEVRAWFVSFRSSASVSGRLRRATQRWRPAGCSRRRRARRRRAAAPG